MKSPSSGPSVPLLACFVLAVALCGVPTAFASPPPSWPFSWETLPVFTFPSFAFERFFNETEMEMMLKYDILNICCMNIRCNGTLYPVGNIFGCNGTYVPNMERNAHFETSVILSRKPSAKVFQYVTAVAPETWFERQANFIVEKVDLQATDAFGHVITCLHKPWTCAPQVSEDAIYDFTKKETRDYFIEKILEPLLAITNSAGIFFDGLSNIPFHYAQEFNLKMTAAEAAKASVRLAGEIAERMVPLGQYPIFSTELTFANYPEYYDTLTAVLEKKGGMLYMEYFCRIDQPALCLEQIITNIDLASRSVPVQVHSPMIDPSNKTEITYQIAAFLIFAGEYSYFMSGPQGQWFPASPIWHEEYDKRLGKPLGHATTTYEMHVFQQTDNLFNTVQPGCNSSSVTLLGVFDDFAACARLCDRDASCLSFQWTQRSALRGRWSGLCYKRSDYIWNPVVSTAAVSGLKFSTWTRSFESADVELNVLTTDAALRWN